MASLKQNFSWKFATKMKRNENHWKTPSNYILFKIKKLDFFFVTLIIVSSFLNFIDKDFITDTDIFFLGIYIRYLCTPIWHPNIKTFQIYYIKWTLMTWHRKKKWGKPESVGFRVR